jgi:hypothetical protein
MNARKGTSPAALCCKLWDERWDVVDAFVPLTLFSLAAASGGMVVLAIVTGVMAGALVLVMIALLTADIITEMTRERRAARSVTGSEARPGDHS